MDRITYRKLELLDQQIQSCTRCNLYQNGRAKPYWNEYSKYMMVLEAPGKEEIQNNEVIIGKTGRMFWELLAEYQLTKNMFLIMNSVNCRVLNGRKNGKPSELHRDSCRDWIRKYIKVFQPDTLLLFGNYAMHTITGEWGINSFYPNGLLTEEEIYDIKMNVIRSTHPSSMIYGGDARNKVIQSIEKFKQWKETIYE